MVLLDVLQLLLDLVLAEKAVGAVELLVNPAVDVVVAHELKLVLSEAHEKHFETHGEEILVFVDGRLLHLRKALFKALFDGLHQGQVLARQKAVRFHVVHQRVCGLLQIFIQLRLEVQQSFHLAVKVELFGRSMLRHAAGLSISTGLASLL